VALFESRFDGKAILRVAEGVRSECAIFLGVISDKAQRERPPVIESPLRSGEGETVVSRSDRQTVDTEVWI
jgi:hypothetical protein